MAGLGVLALAAVIVSGCGKAKSGDPKDPAKTSRQSEAPKTSEQLAKALLIDQKALTIRDFSMKAAMDCTRSDSPGWKIRCRTVLGDDMHGGAAALVDYQLYDADITFDAEMQPFKKQIVDMMQAGDALIAYTPEIGMKDAQGREVTYEAKCYQARGAKSTPVYCGMMLTPRLFVASGVSPGDAVTQDPSDAKSDMLRASDLALLAVVLAKSAETSAVR